jgi:hypothetical protein
VEKLLEMGERFGGGDEKVCHWCRKGEKDGGKLKRCKGCESVWYCGKVLS